QCFGVLEVDHGFGEWLFLAIDHTAVQRPWLPSLVLLGIDERRRDRQRQSHDNSNSYDRYEPTPDCPMDPHHRNYSCLLEMKREITLFLAGDVDFGLAGETLLSGFVRLSVFYGNDFNYARRHVVAGSGRDALRELATMIGMKLPRRMLPALGMDSDLHTVDGPVIGPVRSAEDHGVRLGLGLVVSRSRRRRQKRQRERCKRDRGENRPL